MLSAKDRLHLLTLSACWSGAASHKVARALDYAVLAIRFPVGDKFAADLALKLYERMLSHQQTMPVALVRRILEYIAAPSALDAD